MPLDLVVLAGLIIAVVMAVVLGMRRVRPDQSAQGQVSPEPGQGVFVKTYRAQGEAAAVRAFQSDAQTLVRDGWVPISQQWAKGDYTPIGAISARIGLLALFAGLVTILMINFLIGLGLLAVAIVGIFFWRMSLGPGTLSVTFERRGTESAAAPPQPRAADERLARLDSLRAAGAVTEEEYAAKRAEILADL